MFQFEFMEVSVTKMIAHLNTITYLFILKHLDTSLNGSLFNEFVCKLGFFWHEWAFKTLVSLTPTHAKKSPIYTRTS
jgi:hypothetical protein